MLTIVGQLVGLGWVWFVDVCWFGCVEFAWLVGCLAARPKVRLWDLPGAGTAAVPAETYLQVGAALVVGLGGCSMAKVVGGWLVSHWLWPRVMGGG